jgi:hypothetical protein
MSGSQQHGEVLCNGLHIGLCELLGRGLGPQASLSGHGWSKAERRWERGGHDIEDAAGGTLLTQEAPLGLVFAHHKPTLC